MITGDTISKVTSILNQGNLDKLRSCYAAYSTDWDGQVESRNYESKIQTIQKKARNVAWANDVISLSNEKLSQAAQKHFTQRSTLDALIKEANGIISADRAANMARAKEIDAKYQSFAGRTLSNEQIAQAREFIKSFYNTPDAVLAFCQRATRSEIAKFESRLLQNLTDNNHKAQAAELDQKFLALKSVKRDQAYFANVDAVISRIRSTPSEVCRFCNVATVSAINALTDIVQAEKKYLAAEEQIERLAIAKARTMAWCDRVWREYTQLSREIEHYRNAQKLMDLYNDANKIYTDLICEPYVQALKESTDFKTVFARDEELKTFDKKNVLYQGIPLFDTKWKKRMELAWKDARTAAASYCKEGKELYKKENYTEAFKLFTDAVTYGNADAQYMLGEHYYYGHAVAENLDTAISYYKSAANNGVLQAMTDLGYIYEHQKASLSEAFYWRKRAVDAGSTASRIPLAKLYLNGKGTTCDYAAAKALFEKAADSSSEANAYLGQIYEKGLGVTVNEPLALTYYQKATDITWAKKAYDALHEKLEEERLDQEIADNLAFAKAGNAESQRFIGECYYYGYRTDRSYDMAKLWFERAAAQGNGRAMKLLGDMYHYGYGVNVDLNKALKYYDDAIRHGEK